ncbi:MAG: 50S ribosomal protein L24 [Patescibacteria group bacterium]
MKVKEGDTVRLLTGKDKGKTGKIVQVFPKHMRVVVEGVNKAVKHLKKQSRTAGKKIDYSSPLHISNVQVVSPKTGKPGRVQYKFIEKEGKKTKIRVLITKDGPEDLE